LIHSLPEVNIPDPYEGRLDPPFPVEIIVQTENLKKYSWNEALREKYPEIGTPPPQNRDVPEKSRRTGTDLSGDRPAGGVGLRVDTEKRSI
jgi:hypothetical protein